MECTAVLETVVVITTELSPIPSEWSCAHTCGFDYHPWVKVWYWTWQSPHLNAALPCMEGTRTQAISSPASHFKQDSELCGRTKVAQVNIRVSAIDFLEYCYLTNGLFSYCVFKYILLKMLPRIARLCSVSVLVLTLSWTGLFALFWPSGWRRCGVMLSRTDFVIKGISKRTC